LRALSLTELCLPLEVPVPVVASTEPAFLTESWLNETLDLVLDQQLKEDSIAYRKPPMALVRCSRGGKTRALYELSSALKKKLPGAAIIYITLNDYSNLKSWEQSDPISAICRRIAFAARKLTSSEFDANVSISKDVILQWLGKTPCVLLIDELNKFECLSATGSAGGSAVSHFLKDVFLTRLHRYLIFSSHVVYITNQLSGFMESVSSRNVLIRHLPLIDRFVYAFIFFV